MTLRILAAAALAGTLAATPAAADEFTETIDAALAAYADGDINTAIAELEFGLQILSQLSADVLSGYLPEPMAGSTFEAEDSGAVMMAFGGGGAAASGTYTDADGRRVEIQLIAGNQFVISMGAMFSNPALMGASGATVKRIAGERFAITPDGEISGMIGEVLMQIGGDADVDAKIAYIEAMDLEGMSEEEF